MSRGDRNNPSSVRGNEIANFDFGNDGQVGRDASAIFLIVRECCIL
jgi:hypothetical protein